MPRPLKLTNPVNDVAVLNKWAEEVNTELLQAKNVQKFVATKAANASVTNITNNITGANDGLLHSDAPWPADAAYTIYRDDFMYSQTATATLGESRWQLGTNGGVFKTTIGAFNNPGVLQMFANTTTSSTTTSSQGCNIFPLFGVPNLFWDATWPLFDYPGWRMSWVFGLGRGYNPKYGGSNSGMVAFTLTKQSMYVGMANDSNASAFIGAGRPPIFFGCRFDTDTTAPSIGDTTFWLEAVMNPPQSTSTRNNIQGTNGGAFNTGIVPVEGKFYRLDMVYASSGQLKMTLSGNGATATTTFTITPMSMLYKSAGLAPINSNGITNVNTTPNTFSTTNGYLPQAPGSIVTMSGWASTNSPLNGTFTILQSDINATPFIFTPGGFTTPVVGGTDTMVGYPSILPMASMTNDTQASQPSANSRALNLDLFEFVSNGGLRGATSTNPLNSRYFL